MFKQVAQGGQRVGWRRRAGVALAGGLMATALAVGTAAPAQAGIGMYYVTSNWWQAYAELSSTPDQGTFQAYAYLGNIKKWGAVSTTYTIAVVNDYSWTHNAHLYRNGYVWASAQS